ncbi:hypothetical protein D3C79_1062890 [compost metagenome]
MPPDFLLLALVEPSGSLVRGSHLVEQSCNLKGLCGDKIGHYAECHLLRDLAQKLLGFGQHCLEEIDPEH